MRPGRETRGNCGALSKAPGHARQVYSRRIHTHSRAGAGNLKFLCVRGGGGGRGGALGECLGRGGGGAAGYEEYL